MKTIVDLGPNECRWPVAEEEGRHLFCAAETDDLESYCEAHGALEFESGRRRRREFSSGPVFPQPSPLGPGTGSETRDPDVYAQIIRLCTRADIGFSYDGEEEE